MSELSPSIGIFGFTIGVIWLPLTILLTVCETDVSMRRWPKANIVALVALTLSYVLNVAYIPALDVPGFEPLSALFVANPVRYIWPALLPPEIMHLGFYMIALWAYGNPVNAKLGQVGYVLSLLALGALASITHMLIYGEVAAGATGAISGVMGMFLVLYPLSEVKFIYQALLGFRVICLRTWLVFLGLFAMHLLGIYHTVEGGAWFAHSAGFLAGIGLASVLLLTGLIQMESGERSLFDLVHSQRSPLRKNRNRTETVPADYIVVRCGCGGATAFKPEQAKHYGRCIHCHAQLEVAGTA